MTEVEGSFSGSSEQFEIHVKRIGKGEHVLSFFIDSDSCVLDLKRKISSELEQLTDDEHIPTERQRLIFSGRMLQADEQNLKDARMKPNTVNCIHLTPLPVGARPSVREDDPAILSNNAGAAPGAGRRTGSGQRRRRVLDDYRVGFHPYAFAIPARILMSGGAARSGPFAASIPPQRSASARNAGDLSASSSQRESSGSRGSARELSSRSARANPAQHQQPRQHTISLIGMSGPFMASPAGLLTMFESSFAPSVSIDASQESAERMRRATLTHLLELTSRRTARAASNAEPGSRRSRATTAATETSSDRQSLQAEGSSAQRVPRRSQRQRRTMNENESDDTT